MSRKQIGLRMKDETRDQLERVRGTLSRTDYIEGAVLAQIARDLKKTDIAVDIIEDERIPPNMVVAVPSGEVFVGGETIEKPFFGGGIMGPPIGPQEPGEVYPTDTPEGSPFDKATIMTGYPLDASEQIAVDKGMERIEREAAEKAKLPNGFAVRSSAESKSGVLPVPKKAVKGRK